MTPAELRAFSEDIAAEYNAGKIRAPVHLDDGCEEELIEIFKEVRAQDWVCGSWRMHYRCLLKGVPPAELKREIMAGRSISLCFPTHRIVSSAMVGGIVPIALGIALGIKRRGEGARVWCFMGDMTYLTGISYECRVYGASHQLPITWVVEDNDKSVCTPTRAVWGGNPVLPVAAPDVRIFKYESRYPHAGAGQRIQF